MTRYEDASGDLLPTEFKEPTEEELLAELKALGIDPIDLDTSEVGELEGIRAIRVAPSETTDYNIDNITLTAEDELDPDLNAELSLLSSNVRPLEMVTETTENCDEEVESIDELKRMALDAKRSGDLELARSFMSKIVSLESLANESISDHQDDNQEHYDSTETVTNMEKRGRNPNRELLKKLQTQSKTCHLAAKVALDAGDKASASEWLQKGKSFELDYKSTSQSNNPIQHEEVTYQVPYEVINEDIEEDTLLINITSFKVIDRSAFTNDPSNEKVTFHYVLSIDDTRIILKSDSLPYEKLRMKEIKFTIKQQQDTRLNSLLHLSFHLFQVKKGFFSDSKTEIASAKFPLTALKSEPTVGLANFTLNNTKGKGVVRVDLKIRVRKAFGGAQKGKIPTREVKFTIVSGDESGRIFNPSTVKSQTKGNEEEMAQVYVSTLESYNVLEYEISMLKQQDGCENDPLLLARLMALEGKLQQLTMAIEMGQLEMDQYIDRLKNAIGESKRLALQAKREGNIGQAQRYMKHIILMEEEITESS